MRTETRREAAGVCACGRRHAPGLSAVEIGKGVVGRAARILSVRGFPRRILLVTQSSALEAASALPDVLSRGGFSVHVVLLPSPCEADAATVSRLLPLCADAQGLLSVGAGTVCDICRRAAYLADKAFAVFAAAPSMDGFASDTAAILQDHFKVSLPAKPPSVILADTEILAAAPAKLKAAGFGDLLAKCIALADWRIANRLTGEYYCGRIAQRVREALRSVVPLVDRLPLRDADAAGTLLRALVTTGDAMRLCGSSRPAGGAEHVVSHFWESMQSLQREKSDLHGRRVGAATGMVARLYHEVVRDADPADFGPDATDWARVLDVYGDTFAPQIRQLNSPTVTAQITPETLRQCWPDICRIVREEIPLPSALDDLLRRAGCARTLDDVGVSETLGVQGLEFHAYMRHRLLLSRLVPMLGLTPDYAAAAGICRK